MRTKYFTLEASLSSDEIKFQSLHIPSPSKSEEILTSNILLARRECLRAARYQASNDLCASSVFGGLYHSLILNMESNPEKCANYSVTPCKKTKITGKSPIDLLPRAVNNDTIKLLEDVDLKFGKEDALFYLETATKNCKKRSIDEMNQDEDDDEDEEDNEEDDDDDEIINETGMEKEALTANIMDDGRIISVLTENSGKYIIFTSGDKKYAITVYSTIEEVAEEQNHKLQSKFAIRKPIELFKETLLHLISWLLKNFMKLSVHASELIV